MNIDNAFRVRVIKTKQGTFLVCQMPRNAYLDPHRIQQAIDDAVEPAPPPSLSPEHIEKITNKMASSDICRAPDGQAEQMLRSARRRAEIIEEYEFVPSSKVAEIVGSTAKNGYAAASRLRAQKRIFAVTHQGKNLYPACQFDRQAGRPLKIIARLCHAFSPQRDRWNGWPLMFWLTSPNGLLEDRIPIDLLKSDPDLVLETLQAELHAFDA